MKTVAGREGNSTGTGTARRANRGVALRAPGHGMPAVAERISSGDIGAAVGAAPPANKTGLPDRLKTGIETLSGLGMDDVRVHYNSPRPMQIQALAYTQGTDIHVAPGQQRHLPHEAWHVAQQKQGRVKPMLQMKGIAINDDGALEREADRMGRQAELVSGGVVAPTPGNQTAFSRGGYPAVVQREVDTWAGTFKADTYDVYENDDAGFNGVDMRLSFKPNAYADATRIGLVQAVLAIKEGKPLAIEDAGYFPPAVKNVGKQRQVPEGQREAGWAIDRTADYGNPMYAGANPQPGQTLATTPADEKFKDIWGEYGYRYNDGKEHKKDATLFDKPGILRDKANSRQVFETAALALDGKHAGIYYGSVAWGWQKDGKDDKPTQRPLELVSRFAPSIKFFHAAVYWDKTGRTSQGARVLKLLPDRDAEAPAGAGGAAAAGTAKQR